MTITQDVWVPSQTAQTATGTRRSRNWERTPGYASLPKGTLLHTLPYNDLQYKTEQDLFVQTTTVKSTGQVISNNSRYDQSVGGLVSYADTVRGRHLSQSMIDAAANSSRIKALGRAADVKANIAVSLKEASKTSDLILSTAKRLLDAYRALRRGRLKEVARLLNISPKNVHKTWLEYQYGWMPLLMEVKGAAEFFAQQNYGRPPRFTVSAKEVVPLKGVTIVQGTGNGGAKVAYTQALSGELVVRTRLKLEVSNPTLSAMQQLGVTNPALYAWEVIPFSFVFDWFISVGDWLTAISALHGLTVLDAMQSISVVDYVTLVSPSATAEDATYRYTEGQRTWQVHHRYYSRSSPSLELLSLRPPMNPPSTSFRKMVTSLALMRAQARTISGVLSNTR